MNAGGSVGGLRGVVESVVPGLAFLAAVTAGASVSWAALAALAVCGVGLAVRALARAPLAPAVTGVVLLGVCALAALRSGSAQAFYLPGLILNAAYAAVLVASTIPLPAVAAFTGGSVPLVGVALTLAGGGSWQWRRDRALRRRAVALTWMWAALFLLRLAVELPLYASGSVTALGVARLLLGLPPFALLAWVTLVAVRRLPRAEPAASPAPSRSPAP